MEENNKTKSFMVKLSTFIVDKRNLFFLIFAILIIFSMFSRNWVEVENDLTAYLPDGTETKFGLELMEEEFTTFGSAKLSAANITIDEAKKIEQIILDNNSISICDFDVSDELCGIDGASYKGKAEPIPYQTLMSIPNIPEDFNSFTLKFIADDTLVDEISFSYGDSFDEDILPEIPEKDGCYAEWNYETMNGLHLHPKYLSYTGRLIFRL